MQGLKPARQRSVTVVIDSFLKSEREMVVGEISDFKGKTYAHVRIVVPSAADEGEWVYTEKGVGVPLEDLPKLADGIHKLAEVAGRDRVVASLPAGKDEIRIGTNVFRNNQYVFVRRFFQKNGEWYPSPRGISLLTTQLDELVSLMDRLLEEAATGINDT